MQLHYDNTEDNSSCDNDNQYVIESTITLGGKTYALGYDLTNDKDKIEDVAEALAASVRETIMMHYKLHPTW